MNTRTVSLLFGKLIILTVLLIVCFAVASQISGLSSLPSGSTAPPADPGDIMKAMLISSFLQVIVLSYIILRSRWTGWKLAGTIFLAFYGSMTVIAQSESIVYLQIQLPPGMISRLFITGAIVAALFSPIAVVILGKMRRGAAADNGNMRLVMSKNEWIWKMAAIVVVYVFLYYLFGYYVAWKNPAVQKYYGGSDPGTFIAQIGTIVESTPWIFPFQAFRALLWVALVLPMVRMLKGNSLEVAVVMAFFLSVWSAQLLMPNPYMPAEVAQAHLVETALSNFILGMFIGWLLSRHHSSLKDLVKVGRGVGGVES